MKKRKKRIACVVAAALIVAASADADVGNTQITAVTSNGNCVGVDDTSRVQTALNSATGVVQFSPGTFCFSAPLNLPARPLHLRGGGMEVTELQWTVSGTNGIVGTYSTYYTTMTVTISEVSISRNGLGAGAAISLNWPNLNVGESINEPTARIYNVSIRPFNHTSDTAWQVGIRLDDAWNTHITDISVHGRNAEVLPNENMSMEYGIHLVNGSQDVVIQNVKFYNMEKAIFMEAVQLSQVEGTLIDKIAVVNALVGVHSRSSIPGGLATQWLVVSNSHMNTRDKGIFLERRREATITGNSFYVSTNTAGYAAVYLEGSPYARVSSNHINTPTGPSHYGVIASNSSGTTITGNQILDAGVTIWFNNSIGCTATGNAYRNGYIADGCGCNGLANNIITP